MKLEYVPHGLSEINEYYGNPDQDGNFELDLDWAQDRLKRYRLPFEMKLSWGDQYATHIKAHVLVGEVMIDALAEIRSYQGLQYLRDHRYDELGGVWNFRKMGAYPALSTHSWGISIDNVPHLGAYGADPQVPDFIVSAFKDRGFIWGGDWPPKWPADGMHFQAAKGY